ncbi:universal stress protein [Natronococcus wangiae]|uniref:universal stress protein n=1 Tax=Natronococcus wangiae TaxID=3068275 RepID=UPI00273FB3E7|nr:universal stress protein [Natronococcus sp. AD5]
MYQDILVATDGSDIATTAAEQGLAVAQTLGATVHAVSVVEHGEHGGPDDAERARHRQFVETVEADAVDRGVSVVTSVRTGQPSRELLGYVDEQGIDLLVLGTHGRTGIRRWLMGSVATAVVREARCPVLTVNASVTGVPRDFDDVLIATDGRPGVAAAVENGLDLAEAYGSRVHAVYVVNDVHSHMSMVLEAFEEIGERSTSEIADRAEKRGLEVERSIERGVPHEEIVTRADAHDIDLVVVGTEGRTGLDRLIAGSVSQRVIGDASVPVLSVRTREERTET